MRHAGLRLGPEDAAEVLASAHWLCVVELWISSRTGPRHPRYTTIDVAAYAICKQGIGKL